MRTPKKIIADIKSNKKDDDPEKMDFLMKTIKAVHSASTNPNAVTSEELEKQRASNDAFARLATSHVTVSDEAFNVGDMPCKWYRPKFAYRKDKIILYCHGGGYISGGLGYAGVLGAKLASHTGLAVVTFEYRLSPENKYPCAIDDAQNIWDYLMLLGYGARDIIVAGDSAGGNLALELCIRLKEQERLLPKALVLFSPWTDMKCQSGSYKTYKDKDPLLTYEYVVAARIAYAGEDADYDDPHLSPLYANLSGMPPMLIQVGSNEILRDDSEKLARALRNNQSMCELQVYQGGWHVFQQMPIPKATHAMECVKDFVDEVLY